ncbi:MAG TPA: GNAT family N-acetyltransferase [Burkholderiales bacterium]|nr:GNAT family N-acetyltransferase [Burkholderiales bacterium]
MGSHYNVTVYDSLEDLPPACAELFEEQERSSIFFGQPWLRNLAQHGLDEGDSLRIYVVSDAKGILGVLPMRHATRGSALYSLHRIEALANYYASLFRPVLRKNDEQAALRALADAVAKDTHRFDIVDIHPLPHDEPWFAWMKKALQVSGMLVQTYFCFGNWYLKVDGRSYREYYDTFPSQLKNTLKRKTKQFDAGGSTSIEICTRVEELDRAIAAYEKVYHSSWKVPEPHPRFMPGLIRFCAEKGWLRLGVAYVEGEPVAAQVWIVHEGIAAIYKLAYDEKYAKLSAGSILTSKLMEYVIEVDKVHEVDYLTGDDGYKKDWMSHRRERWGMVAYNLRTVKGLAYGTAYLGWTVIKRMRARWRRFSGKTLQETPA